MSESNYLFFLITIAVLLSSCTTSRLTTSAGADCSCRDYLPERPRPGWAGVDGSSVATYLSHGISECTGIQSMDFEEADASARSNLGRVLSTHVESEVVLIREDFGGAGGSRGKITSKQSTDSLLEKSTIYDRWLDRGSCVLYSAVRISRADIQATIKRIELERQNKLVNQSFLVKTEGEYSNKLAEKMQQLLIDSGVRNVTESASKNTYTLYGTVASKELIKQGRLAKVTIQLKIIDPKKNFIWMHQAVGKGVSFSAASKEQLFNKALVQAIDNMAASITEVFHKQGTDSF